jgi:hypothetical protein
MDQTSWIMLLLGIAVACGLIALVVVLYPKLRSEKQGYPLEAQLEAALLPMIYQGICSAYRLSENSMDEIQCRLKGADKRAIAVSIYSKLSNRIGDHDVVLIKRYVTQERFETLVQRAFYGFDGFFQVHKDHFRNLFEDWKARSVPA